MADAFIGGARAPGGAAARAATAGERIGYAAAARHLGIKVSTLRSMVHRRQVPHIRLGPQLVVFDVADLDEWMAACRVAPIAPG